MIRGENAIQVPAAKVASAWAAVGITSWSDVAAVLAALYTMILMAEWFWKRMVRPYCERKGWIRRISRRQDDFDE